MIYDISIPIKIFQAVLNLRGKGEPRWFRPHLKKQKGGDTEDIAYETLRLIIKL